MEKRPVFGIQRNCRQGERAERAGDRKRETVRNAALVRHGRYGTERRRASGFPEAPFFLVPEGGVEPPREVSPAGF